MTVSRLLTWLRQLPIRTRLIGLVAVALLPAFAVALSHLQTRADLARASARQQAWLLTTHTTAALDDILLGAESLLAALARRPPVRLLDPAGCDPAFGEVDALNPAYLALWLWRVDGSAVCASDPTATKPAPTAAWFNTSLMKGGPRVSDAYLDPQRGRWTVLSSYPVAGDGGTAVGLLVLVLDLDALNRRTLADAPAGGMVTVTDRRWRVLLRQHDHAERVGQPMPQRLVAELDRSAEGQFVEQGLDGVLRLYAFQTVARTGWRVVAGLPRDTILADYRMASTWTAILLALALGGAVIVALLLARSIVGPVSRLSQVALAVARGDASRRAMPTGPREVAAVAKQFNHMLDVQVENEARFRALTALSSDWYWEQDAEFRFTSIGPRVGEVVDLSAEEHLGKRRWELGDIGLSAWQLQQHRRQLERHEPFRDLVVKRRGRDGKPRYAAISGEPVFDADGRFAGYRGVGRDITAQYLAEEAVRAREAQYRELIEHLSAGVVVRAPDASVLMANRAALQLLGLSLEQLQGKAPRDPAWRFVREDGQPLSAEELPATQVKVSGQPVADRVIGVERHAGAERVWLLVQAYPEFDGQSRLTRIVVTFSDITALRRAGQLRSEKEAVDMARRSQFEFLSRVSHELRTPLNSILGFGQLLQLDPTVAGSAATRERVGHVVVAGRHLLAMVNDILDVTRAEAGALALSTEAVDVVRLVRECAALVQPEAARRTVRVEAAVAPGDWQVRGDPSRLRQILMNLLSNAVKYNRDGGRVAIRVGGDDSQVRVAVEDSGAGLAPAQVAALFQPFNRLGAERSGTEGTGLGLVIARLLAQAMGGDVGVDSRPGEGSVFTLALPRIVTQDTNHASGADAAAVTEPPAAAFKLLYVEDDPASLQLVEQALTTLPQVTLVTAADGVEGLALARRERPDLILLDLNLPQMDGFTLLRRLRADPAFAGVPCIALSANAMPGDIERALAAGFNDYVTKPYDVEQLLARLRHWAVKRAH